VPIDEAGGVLSEKPFHFQAALKVRAVHFSESGLFGLKQAKLLYPIIIFTPYVNNIAWIK